MKYFILFIGLIFVKPAISQPIIDGALHQVTVSGTTFLYQIPTSANRATLHYYFILYGVDSTGKDSAYCVSKGFGKKIKNGWNGYQPLTNGDSVVFSSILIITDPTAKANIENAIQYAHDNFPAITFDTSRHSQNILTSFGLGANSFQTYLLNTGFLGTEKFDKCFRKNGFADIYTFNVAVTQWANLINMGSWFFYGGSNTSPFNTGYTIDSYDSALAHNPSPNTKITSISGQNYSTITHDSIYSSVGNDAASNIFRFWYDPYEGIDTSQQKIAVDSFMVIDYGGFWARASYSTYWYFDSQGDPLHGNLTADNTTGNTSIGVGLYYQDAVDNGIVYNNHVVGVDFTRDTSTTMYDLSEVWIYIGNSSSSADTIMVIAGDSAMSANYIFNLRNSVTPTFYIITTGGCNCWQRVWQGHAHTQHVLVSYRRHSNGDETAVNGIVFYGHALPGQGISTYQYDSSFAIRSDTFRQDVQYLEGGNFYNNYDTAYMKPMHHRDGINTIFKGSNDSLVIQAQQNPSSRNYTDSLIKVNYPQVHQYYSWQGAVTKVFNQTSGDAFQRPVDSIGADWRIPYSFFTLGKLMFNEAFSFGNNPSANNAYYKSKGGWIKANNTLYGAEPGNEANNPVFGNYWQDPISMAAMLTMCINGCNNTLPGYGVKQADPNFKIYVPATATIDLRYQVAVMRLLQYYYHTAHPPIDYFGFHSYPQNAKKGIALTTNESIGGFILNPSAKGYFQDKVFANQTMNGYWHGSCPITYSEEGADKQYLRTTTANGQFDSSLAGIVQYGSFTPAQSLAIYQVTCLALDACTSTREAMVYAFPDFDAPNASNLYHTFSGAGWEYFYLHPITFQIDSVKYWDAWFYYQGIANSLWGYKCVQILDSNSSGLWRLKFRSLITPNHVKYLVWNDNPNNSTIATSLTLGATVGTVLSQQGQFNSLSLTSTTVFPSGGVLSVSVGSQHVIIDATEVISIFRGFPLQGRTIHFGN